jgi:hypothetical protein
MPGRGPSGSPHRKRCNVRGALEALRHALVAVPLVLDNARSPKCARRTERAAPLGVEWLDLPSGCPNLNGIERLGKFVPKECLSSVHSPNDEALSAAIAPCLQELPTKHKPARGPRLTQDFLTFANGSIRAA